MNDGIHGAHRLRVWLCVCVCMYDRIAHARMVVEWWCARELCIQYVLNAMTTTTVRDICLFAGICTCWKDFIHFVYFSVYSISLCSFTYLRSICTCRRVDTHAYTLKSHSICHSRIEIFQNDVLVPSLSSHHHSMSRHHHVFLQCRRRRRRCRHRRRRGRSLSLIVAVHGLNVVCARSLYRRYFGLTHFR